MPEPFFVTEKKIEEWLTFETRSLPMPDGTMKPFTGFKFVWNSLDFLILCGQQNKFSRAQFVALAIEESSRTGREFFECFSAVVSAHYKELQRKLDGR